MSTEGAAVPGVEKRRGCGRSRRQATPVRSESRRTYVHERVRMGSRSQTQGLGAFLVVALLALLALGVAGVRADPFEEAPPPWEPLLWGGTVSAPARNGPEIQKPPASAAIGPEEGTKTASPPIVKQPEPAYDASADPKIPPAEGLAGMLPPFEPEFAGIIHRPMNPGSSPRVTVDWSRQPYSQLVLKTIPPLYRAPELPGEGVWQSKDMPTGPDGKPAIWKTSYRPSVEYPNAVAHMLVFDMKRLSMRLYLGSAEPAGSAVTSKVAKQDWPQVLAITNAFWKQKHSGEAGTIFAGQVIKELAPGLATLVVYQDDSVDIIEWHEGIPLSLIRHAKQLRHLIVKDGKVVESIVRAGQIGDSEIGLGFLLSEDQSDQPPPFWYGWGGWQQPETTRGPDWFIATRSAFGIRPDGNLVFAVGHHISTKDLAKALVLAGCERGIHGDANPHNVLGNLYQVSRDGSIMKKERLSPEQKTYTVDRYVDKSYTSDFFAFFVKPLKGTHGEP